MPFPDPIPGDPPPPPASNAEQAALDKVKLYCAPDCAPTLSDADLLAMLRDSRKWQTWQASTFYPAGAIISPEPFTGFGFECVHAGASGNVQPEVLTVGSEELLSCYGRMPDNNAIWRFKGKLSGSGFDIRLTIHKAWLKKAALTAREHNHSPGGNQRFDREALHLHCMKMAGKYAPVRVL